MSESVNYIVSDEALTKARAANASFSRAKLLGGVVSQHASLLNSEAQEVTDLLTAPVRTSLRQAMARAEAQQLEQEHNYETAREEAAEYITAQGLPTDAESVA